VPTSTDLVKDGATAIEALGDGIDTSMVDLKGGTTGQILAKATSADMDFAWITNDVGDITAVTAGTGISGGGTSGAVTITNSMATEIAAKGDLIAGTGSQTFDNLTVGANNTMLVGDSTAATGLAYKSAATLYAYSSWTPTLGAITIGNGNVNARFARIGKTVNFMLIISLGSTTAVTGRITFTLPSTANQLTNFSGMYSQSGSDFMANIFHTGGTVYCDAVLASGTYASGTQTNATTPFTWGANTYVFVNGTYEETA
jgi:hypothetical protein